MSLATVKRQLVRTYRTSHPKMTVREFRHNLVTDIFVGLSLAHFVFMPMSHRFCTLCFLSACICATWHGLRFFESPTP